MGGVLTLRRAMARSTPRKAAARKNGGPKNASEKSIPDRVLAFRVSLECRSISLCITSRRSRRVRLPIPLPIRGTGAPQYTDP